MSTYKNLGKNFLIYVLFLLIITLFLNIFYYFNLLSDLGLAISSLALPLILLFYLAYSLGRKAQKHGFLEGLKLGGCVIFFYFLLNVLAFNGSISLKLLLYYSIFLLSSILGSMIGINKKA